jgi:hypothetical protein
MDKGLDPVAAIKTSWDMTNGHAINIFLIGLLAIPIVLIGIILLLVGVIPASMWVEGAFASMYHSVNKQLELAKGT